MAVVTYQCTVCKRSIDLVQNKAGLDWVGNCNITLGCRGALVQQEVHPDYIRGSLPADVVGLKNWVQRQVLYNFTQTVTRQTWVITHNLGTLPSVQVYGSAPTSDNPENVVEVLPEQIVYNSDDQLTLTLPRAYSGIAQLIARSSNPDLLNPRPRPAPTTTTPTIQVTSDTTINGVTTKGEITIATRLSTVGNPSSGINISLLFTPSAGSAVPETYTASPVAATSSPWSDVQQVLFKGKVYTVRTFNVQTGSGLIPNGSSVTPLGITLPAAIVAPIVAITPAAKTFTINSDYSEDFTPGTLFQTNDTYLSTWIVESSIYELGPNETTIRVTTTIPVTFVATTITLSGSRQIVPNEVIILLGSSPFTIYDKIVNSYIDLTATTTPATQFDLFYNAGDLFANTSIQQSIYPPLRSV